MDSNDFAKFLSRISSTPLRVLDTSIPNSKYIYLDLSYDNSNLEKIDASSSESLSRFVNSHIKLHHALVAFGGYNEIRSIYQRSNHFNINQETERNVHLGIDLWCGTNTPIYAPIDARVHSFKNNKNHGDYGPTIILKHVIKDVLFYTLYGHLSMDSILNLKVGQFFKKGDCIARLGDSDVNGDYPPHLHFQIIKDIESYTGDYPGVCSKNDLDFYLKNCPDPNLILKLA
ncbi:peptidoglycan DD-metalloendopeptidase family protein [Hyunsoonleella aestuarii]|uniref:M23ase beta-sheet core domain-containing protein n=1 Tax=Hyunsoonleella aestuarii TaxID=912802 RepID=A0ABP8ECC4_9FLAO|nr:peptidoglycan DD-metalloendopeptidase family protein [Hyunsoonleella aestuarii]